MQTVLSRPKTVGGSGTNSTHRVPRRSSSFLSLRRDKDRSPAHFNSDATLDSPELSQSSRPSYPDAHSRMKSASNTHSTKFKSQRSSSSLPSEQLSHQNIAGPSYPFPTPDTSQNIATPILSPRQYRTRYRTGPSGHSSWEEAASIPQLRFSGSSTQHTETPPHTPLDTSFSRDFENFPVVVAAPVAGVETMDALVDGMNGGDDILSSTSSISNRARFGIPGHHPLYQPPLPTPPPGVVLGGGKARRAKHNIAIGHSSESDDDDHHKSLSASRPRPRRTRPTSPRAFSSSKITTPTTTPPTPEATMTRAVMTDLSISRPGTTESLKTIVPSISDIIRAHAPPEGQIRSRPPTARSSSHYARSQDHPVMHEDALERAVLVSEEEADFISRSSIDSVADEVQRTLRTQYLTQPPPTAPPSSFPKRHSTISDNTSIYSPRSDPGAMSVYSTSSNPYPPPSFDDTSFVSLIRPSSTSQEVAKYLRSTKLTTLLQLTRSPHASGDNPLTVSLSDLGSPTGHPVVVFLGLGCVRHIMGLYDEMAEILNLRLIAIDRWGLGRTEARLKSTKGIIQWAAVVEEVLDLLHIETCSIMAHSAGAPYALSFANMVPERIRGDICLLAPWVGGSESSGYKWLKYVPNGILKTAQAAEWKIQAWMIGKPPTIPYQGIGYSAVSATKTSSPQQGVSSPRLDANFDTQNSSLRENRPRPSLASSTFSEYDDLRDFDGRFESRSTLGMGSARPSLSGRPNGKDQPVTKRKPSRGFLGRLKSSTNPLPPAPDEKPPNGGKRLKALRSMGSLKNRSTSLKKPDTVSPRLPPSLDIEVGLGFGKIDWPRTQSDLSLIDRDMTAKGPYMRSNGNRSVSFTSSKATTSMPCSPSMSSASVADASGNGYQAALGNALIAASHAESAKGTHSDLLRILNHENHSWGFTYSSYPHRVKVWYGDKDEKIAENAVQWMAKNMGEDKCSVRVVVGADHGLMYRSSVVVEVLEHVLSFWKSAK